MLWGPHRLFHANNMVSVVRWIRSYYIKKGMIYSGLEWPTLTYNVLQWLPTVATMGYSGLV